MLLSAVSVLVVLQSSSEVPEALMNKPVYELSILVSNLYCSPAAAVVAMKWQQLMYVKCMQNCGVGPLEGDGVDRIQTFSSCL